MSSASAQELRSHFLRRLPTPKDLSVRSPIVLTERDAQILVAVHQHGFLTTGLVELAFFPPQFGSRDWSSSKAYERVRELWLWGYLERVELPVARVLGGRRPFLYALGQQGVPMVETRIGTPRFPVQPRRIDRLDHDLKAAALWANLRAYYADRDGCRFGWTGERELRARRMRVRSPSTGYWMPFLPDAYFEVTDPDGDTRCVVVEIDMGTLTLRRFPRKMQAFEAALGDGVFRHHFNRHDFEVLVLTQSRRRLDWLRKTAAGLVDGSRHAGYLFTTFDALEPSAFANAQCWNLSGDKMEGIVYDD